MTALAARPMLGTFDIVDGSPFPHAWGVLHADRLMHPVDVSDWPVKIDAKRQLFVDDYLLAKHEGVRRVLHQPRKHPANPVMVAENDLERPSGPVLGRILRDTATGRFRLWYGAGRRADNSGRRHGGLTLYAESADGIHWERPKLSLVAYNGSTDNNIVLAAGALSGLIHQPEDSAAPWKAILDCGSRLDCPEGVAELGRHLFTSSDGIHWQHAALCVPHGRRWHEDRSQVLPLTRIGDTSSFRWDPVLERYIGDTKGTIPNVLGTRPYRTRGADDAVLPDAEEGDTLHRFRLQMESDDLIHWTPPRVVSFPDQADWERGVIGHYAHVGFPYESMWLGFLRVHRVDPWKKVDVQLLASHDGRIWSRACERQTFLPLGPEGSWEPDYSGINHAGPLVVGDELWLFYRGSILHRHRGTGPYNHYHIGLATLRRDGFASLAAGPEGGQVTTRPLTFTGHRLFVNATMAAGGSLRVAVLDRHGHTLPGLTLDDCHPVTGDSRAAEVRWQSNGLQARPAGPLRLRFEIRDADLYAFWLE